MNILFVWNLLFLPLVKQLQHQSVVVKLCVCVVSRFSHFWLCATLWTVAHQAPLSVGFCRQDFWSELPCPPPGDLSNPEIKPTSLASPALAGGFFTTSSIWEEPKLNIMEFENGLCVSQQETESNSRGSWDFNEGEMQEVWVGLKSPTRHVEVLRPRPQGGSCHP